MTHRRAVANVHAVLPRSRANGPGWRFVIWFQGCTLGCPGCFNPDTHPHAPCRLLPVDELAAQCVATPGIEGITLSGGEPLQQPGAVRALVDAVRRRSRLSVVLFSGYALAEIRALAEGPAILGGVDVLVAGRYRRDEACADGLRTSRNQVVHRLSARYGAAELAEPPLAEIIIGADGGVVRTGLAGRPVPGGMGNSGAAGRTLLREVSNPRSPALRRACDGSARGLRSPATPSNHTRVEEVRDDKIDPLRGVAPGGSAMLGREPACGRSGPGDQPRSEDRKGLWS